jgi:hypothetical protein
VLPGLDKHSRPHLPKTTAIFEAFMATYQKICRCMIFQSTTTIKKHKAWGGILLFFICPLHFGIKHYTNFLNLTKFVLKHPIATHSHFHAANFFSQIISYTACFELFSSGHGHLATLNFGSDSTRSPSKFVGQL